MPYLFLVLTSVEEAPLHEIPVSHEHPDVSVDVGFCRGNDHLMIGIGGNRFGQSVRDPHGFLAGEIVNGIYASFELWAAEEDITAIFERAMGMNFRHLETLVNITVVGEYERGWTDAVINALRTDDAFLQQMKAIVLKRVRLFRENELVARQTEYWRRVRTNVIDVPI